MQVKAVAGQRSLVVVPLDAMEDAPSKEAPEENDEVTPVLSRKPLASTARTRGAAALIIGGVGVLAFGGSTLIALDARSDYRSAFDAHCDAASKRCDAQGVSLTGDARSQANLATLLGGVALAAMATGAILYFTTPNADRESSREVRYLRPVLSSHSVGVAFGGSL
jgi:hypothetical protein